MKVVWVVTLAACSSAATSSPPLPVEAPHVSTVRPPDPSPPPLRLPGDVAPVRYRLEQTIVPTDKTVAGAIHIDATVIKPTRVVWLNATDITIARADLAGKQARLIAGGEDFVGLTTDTELPAGPLAIDVTYKSGVDHERARGIYAQAETGKDSDTYAYTFFEPIDARRAFPCFDEPNYKVPWTLVFHVKKDHVALANAPVVKETDEPDGMKRVELAESKPLPSYLVAFVVGPFELVDGGTAGRIHTPIRFIIPKGRSGELGYAKEVTPKVLVALEDYFDMDYPYIKLDVAVVPRFWGTMEHPGIVAMGQPLTLIRPDEATRNRREGYANILAHEMSHYWFGDLVTMKWWDDTWLNEALGEWSDVNITEAVEPSWNYRDVRSSHTASAMYADEKLTTHEIRRAVTKRSDIQASFDNAITYYKGASLFRMLEAYVGRDKWRGFIHTYLSRHAWKNATAEDFLGDMASVLGNDITEAARSFIVQSGVPRVEATATCGATSSIVLHQTRSLPFGVTDPSEKLWKIPVCMRVGTSKGIERVCKLLDKREDSVSVSSCPTWIVTNDDGNGYYRSKVDTALVRRELAKGSGASYTEKSLVIMDLYAAIDRQEVPFEVGFALAPVLLADPNEKIQAWAPGMLSFVESALDDRTYNALTKARVDLLRPLARKLGWVRSKNDSDDRHRLRRQLLHQVAPYDDVLGKQAEAFADKWIETQSGIDDELVGAALYTAAYRGDEARFDRYLAAAKNARDRRVQVRLLSQLGSFRSRELATRALGLVLDGGIDLRDSSAVLWDVMENRETQDLGLAWIKTHLDQMLAKMRDDEATGLLGGLAGLYCDAERSKVVQDLVKPHVDKIDGADIHVARVIEGTDLCIKRVARELPSLKKFLKLDH